MPTLFDVVLIWLPGWANGMNGLQFQLQLPFVPQKGMAIELKESVGGSPATLPYIDKVEWNVERSRFECRVAIYWGLPYDEANDHLTREKLLNHGWSELTS